MTNNEAVAFAVKEGAKIYAALEDAQARDALPATVAEMIKMGINLEGDERLVFITRLVGCAVHHVLTSE